MKQTCILISLMIICSITFAFSKQNVAVYDLNGHKITKEQAAIFSDRVRTELTVTDAFNVMERTQMDAILKEMEFQMSGMCDETSCLVEVGRMLTVDRIVSGSIGLIGSNYYTITLRILNVQTGEILTASAYEYEGDEKGFLSVGIREAVRKLTITAGFTVTNKEGVGKTADLYLTSDPDSAEIEINGITMKQKTPALLSNIIAGSHAVVLRKGELFASEEITLKPNDLMKKNLILKHGTGELSVLSSPLGASIFVDGDSVGITPHKIENLSAGVHHIALQLKNHLTFDTSLGIKINETSRISAVMPLVSYLKLKCPQKGIFSINGREAHPVSENVYEAGTGQTVVSYSAEMSYPWSDTLDCKAGTTIDVIPVLTDHFGTITIQSHPEGAQVFVKHSGSETVGVTPFTFSKTEPGTAIVQIKKDDYDIVDTTVQISAGDTTNCIVTLPYRLAHIVVTTKDSGSASVFLNDRLIGKTPYTVSAAPGKAVLKVAKDSTYLPNIHELNICKGDSIVLSETFGRTPEWTAKRKQKHKNVRRILFGSLSALSLGGALIAEKLVGTANEKYLAYDGDNPAEHSEKWNAVESTVVTRNILIGSAGAFALGFSLSIPF